MKTYAASKFAVILVLATLTLSLLSPSMANTIGAYNNLGDGKVLTFKCTTDSGGGSGDFTIWNNGYFQWLTDDNINVATCDATLPGANPLRFAAFDKAKDHCKSHCDWRFDADGVYHLVNESKWMFFSTWPNK